MSGRNKKLDRPSVSIKKEKRKRGSKSARKHRRRKLAKERREIAEKESKDAIKKAKTEALARRREALGDLRSVLTARSEQLLSAATRVFQEVALNRLLRLLNLVKARVEERKDAPHPNWQLKLQKFREDNQSKSAIGKSCLFRHLSEGFQTSVRKTPSKGRKSGGLKSSHHRPPKKSRPKPQ